jgi:hypothetical protein
MLNIIKEVFMNFFSKKYPLEPNQPIITPLIQPEPIQVPFAPPSPIITIGLDYVLSPHFNFGALTKTENRLWIDKNREEAKKYLDTLAKLCKDILEPIYTLIGSLSVTSCFRCPGLNSAIGGSTTSQHCDAEACDMEFTEATEGRPLMDAYNKIAYSNIQYSQILLEFSQWVHIGLINKISHPDKIGQKLIVSSKNGKTVYSPINGPI